MDWQSGISAPVSRLLLQYRSGSDRIQRFNEIAVVRKGILLLIGLKIYHAWMRSLPLPYCSVFRATMTTGQSKFDCVEFSPML